MLKLLEPTEGKIRVHGKDITGLDTQQMFPYREQMQMIYQDPYASLNPRMSAGDIVGEPLIIHHVGTRAERQERVAHLFERVGLRPEHMTSFPHEFSGGQRQRIGIARALALGPELIVGDEPVSALDVSIQAQIINLLMDLQDEFKLSYLFVAHDLAVVEHISHRVAVMYLGRIVETTDKTSLFEMPLHPYTEALLSAVPIPKASARRRNRVILTGDVPSPINPPSGCHFHARCPYVMSRCHHDVPALREVVPGHWTACHLHDGGVRFPLAKWRSVTMGLAELYPAYVDADVVATLGWVERSEPIDHRCCYTAPLSRGSSASRMPSPSRLNANTVSVIAAPGNSTSHHGGTSPAFSESASMLPQVGVGGGMPTPRKPSAASMMIATPRCVVARIKYGATHCGRMCRAIMRICEAPRPRAASTYESSFSDSTTARITRPPNGIRVMAIATITVPMPAPERHRDGHRQYQVRERLQELDEPLADDVEAPAEIAARQAPQRAERGAQQHRAGRHGQRRAAAMDHPAQRVAADLVGAEIVQRRWRLGHAGGSRRASDRTAQAPAPRPP